MEVDAIDPLILRTLVEQCITQHIDRITYDRLLEIEAAEQRTLFDIVSNMPGAGEKGH